MKIINIIILFLAILTVSTKAQFSLELKLEKKDYLIYEPITLLVKVTNESEVRQGLVLDLYSNHSKIILKYNSQTLKHKHVSGPSMNPRNLNPHETSYYTYSLISFLGVHNSTNDLSPFLSHLKEGNYQIQIEYYLGENIRDTNLEEDKIIKSNIVDFNITSPSSKDLINQIEEYKKIMINYSNYDRKEFKSALDEVISLNNQSPYALLANESLIKKEWAACESTNYKKLIEKVCQKFPESYVSLEHIISYPDIREKILSIPELKGTSIQVIGENIKNMKK